MRVLSIILLSLIFCSTFAQEITEKEVKTTVNEVTVFLEGAQIIRKKSVDLIPGKTIIKFVNLSPFIDAKSIQAKAEGELMVLSVNHQQNYLDKSQKSTELSQLVSQLDDVNDKIKIEDTYLSIIKEELSFLQSNKDIGGKNEQLNVTNLQQAADFYGKKLTDLKMKEIERNQTLKTLHKKRNDLQNQINTITSKKDYPTGEVLVKVDTKKAGKYNLELNYLVKNAGWFPSYDIRAKNINEPVQLIYKANVKQDTKVDWTNVKLKFSSAEPNVSGVAPELQPYYLSYNMRPPVYKAFSNTVNGRVFDNTGQPLPGVNVIVDGTTIGTVTDFDGNYSITIPNSSSSLKYSFIGFNEQTLPVTGPFMNVSLQENNTSLDEVVVMGYGSNEDVTGAIQGRMAGVNVKKENVKFKALSSLAIPTAQVENQTTVDFEIHTPYTINSDNKNYTVDMEQYELPAFYQYYCVPKIDKDAFLIANIVDWEKYNLLEGEANVFFEGTYVGKTLMDVRFASDTLEISLGRDKKVSVNREKVKDFTNKQFIGSKKEETRAWKTTVKNNKAQDINMIILDQIPVSTMEEIEVSLQNTSGAKHNTETGEIEWKFKLNANDKKELDLKYAVKYPKNRNLIIE